MTCWLTGILAACVGVVLAIRARRRQKAEQLYRIITGGA